MISCPCTLLCPRMKGESSPAWLASSVSREDRDGEESKIKGDKEGPADEEEGSGERSADTGRLPTRLPKRFGGADEAAIVVGTMEVPRRESTMVH